MDLKSVWITPSALTPPLPQFNMTTNEDLRSTTVIITIKDLPYMVFPAPSASILLPPTLQTSVLKPTPITVVPVDGLQTITSSWLRNMIEKMQAADDVFDDAFKAYIIFRCSSGIDSDPLVEDDVSFRPDSGKSHSWQIWKTEDNLPAGPYFLLGCNIHQAYRLYNDPYGAFLYGVVQSENDSTRWASILRPC